MPKVLIKPLNPAVIPCLLLLYSFLLLPSLSTKLSAYCLIFIKNVAIAPPNPEELADELRKAVKMAGY